MRKHIDEDALPDQRVVIQFRFSDETSEYDRWWVIARPDAPLEVCASIPGFEPDLFVETDTMSLGGIYLARTTVARELEFGRLFISGDALLARTISQWLKPSARYAAMEGTLVLPGRCSPDQSVAAQ